MHIPWMAIICILSLSLATTPLAAASNDEITTQGYLDLLWILVCMVLVFFMQAGFTLLEAGCIRAKNSINVAIKNMSDLVVTICAFFAFGFAIMFGESSSGFFGSSLFFLNNVNGEFELAFFVFQAVFAGTAATICSGAVAERMGFSGYLFAALFISGLIYPVSGHWAWGGALLPDQAGWLSELGFIDFAGSTVVHLLGATVGLAAIIQLGPRIGRFDDNGQPQPLHGHNLALSAVGAMILWFGWFGFNAGSELAMDSAVPKILLNTMIAPAFAGLTIFVISAFTSRGLVVEVEHLINAVLAGLVGITAGCALAEPSGAVAIGIGSALVYLAAHHLMLYFRLDDPVNVVSVHGAAGIWGTLALAFLSPSDADFGHSAIQQLGIQAIGVFAICAWGFVTGTLLFWVLKVFRILRVDPEDEITGLNVSEHGAKTVWLDTVKAMAKVIDNGDFSQRVPQENGTEAGQVAYMFNALMKRMQAMVSEVEDNQTEMKAVSQSVVEVASDLELSIANLNDQMGELRNVAKEGESSKSVVSDATSQGASAIDGLSEGINDIAKQMDRSFTEMEHLQNQTTEITKVIDTVDSIAFQIHLLGVNAAIEAAQAGHEGRGFSIVATETRNLAGNFKESSQLIRNICENLLQRTNSTLEMTKSSADSAEHGNRSMETVTTSFKGIAAAVEQDSISNKRLVDTIYKQHETQENIQQAISRLVGLNDRLRQFDTHVAGIEDANDDHSERHLNHPEESKSDHSWDGRSPLFH